MVRKDQVRYNRWCDGFHRFAHPFSFLFAMLVVVFDSYGQASKYLQYTFKSFLQDCKGMRQCPEERNSLIYDVMFSEYHKRNPGRPPVAAHPHQPSSGYSDKGSDTGYPGKDSRYSDKGSVAGYSSKGPAAGYTSGYSDKGQATGYHSGYSDKGLVAGYHSGYSDKGLVAGYPRNRAQDPVQHSRSDHTRGYSGNGVPSSVEDKVSYQMGRLKTTDTVGDVLSSRRK